jgi:hypothetical protein
MQISVFWDIMPYSPSKVNRRFGVKYSIHLHRQRKSHTKIERGTEDKQDILKITSCFALVYFLAYPLRWTINYPPKRH